MKKFNLKRERMWRKTLHWKACNFEKDGDAEKDTSIKSHEIE